MAALFLALLTVIGCLRALLPILAVRDMCCCVLWQMSENGIRRPPGGFQRHPKGWKSPYSRPWGMKLPIYNTAEPSFWRFVPGFQGKSAKEESGALTWDSAGGRTAAE